MTQDRASWNMQDSELLSELVQLIGLTAEEQRLLGQLQTQAQAVAPRMSAAFYERLQQHDHTAEYLHGRTMEGLHTTLRTWFVELFGGVYDEGYARQRIRIGQRHVEVGIPVRYPLAMIDVIMPFGEEVTLHSPQPAAARVAFHKILALDIAIFNQAYENNQLHYLAELVGSKRLARLLLAGTG